MVSCPNCKRRWPLRGLFSTPFVCSHCNTELEYDFTWKGLFGFVLAMGVWGATAETMGLVRRLVQDTGYPGLVAWLTAVLVNAVVCLLAWVFFVRYRVKQKPLSILHPAQNERDKQS